jgi:hypothetical protein
MFEGTRGDPEQKRELNGETCPQFKRLFSTLASLELQGEFLYRGSAVGYEEAG